MLITDAVVVITTIIYTGIHMPAQGFGSGSSGSASGNTPLFGGGGGNPLLMRPSAAPPQGVLSAHPPSLPGRAPGSLLAPSPTGFSSNASSRRPSNQVCGSWPPLPLALAEMHLHGVPAIRCAALGPCSLWL
eukprot:1161834-Pelagomonas_calceolata.AAC.1